MQINDTADEKSSIGYHDLIARYQAATAGRLDLWSLNLAMFKLRSEGAVMMETASPVQLDRP